MKYSTFRWTSHSNLMISFATEGQVREDEWAEFIRELKDQRFTGYLATNDGAAEVNSLQRKMAAEAIQGRTVAIAVITNERFVRGIVTAASWLGMNVRAFAWAEFDDSLKYLQVSSARRPLVVDIVGKLRSSAAAEGAAHGVARP
jgi:hypothetical protein